MIRVSLIKSGSRDKYKFKAIVHRKDGTSKTVSFGDKRYSDYTKHKDPDRKRRYIARHKTNENWKKSGIETSGFWSRWLLWEKPSLTEAISSLYEKKGINIIRKRKNNNT